jgi:hypothetical protein
LAIDCWTAAPDQLADQEAEAEAGQVEGQGICRQQENSGPAVRAPQKQADHDISTRSGGQRPAGQHQLQVEPHQADGSAEVAPPKIWLVEDQEE